MRQAIDLLRHERRARVFFAVLAQSALGTGAAYVALLLVALDRFHSPWAIGLVLLADVVPAMFLGPLFGAAADRWPRRTCMVAADVVRAAAFAGIVLVDGFALTFVLALVAGIGTGLFTPAALASLPSLVEERRLPAASSLYGAIADFGFIAGPGLAAVLLLGGGPETVLAVNAATFAISAPMLASLRFGAAPPASSEPAGRARSLITDAREGMRAAAGMRGLRLVLVATGAALFFGAIFNVGQPLLAKGELGSGDTGFAVLVTIYGVGFIGGSLSGSKGGELKLLKRRYLIGSMLMSAGFLASGLTPSVAGAMATFLAAGYGNGLLLIYERLLVQTVVPDQLAGRVFGIRDSLTAWAFAGGFLVGPPLLNAFGTRTMIAAAGAAGLVVGLVSVLGLRGAWGKGVGEGEGPLAAGAGTDLAWDRRGGQEGAHLIHG
jgi:MFS family permease